MHFRGFYEIGVVLLAQLHDVHQHSFHVRYIEPIKLRIESFFLSESCTRHLRLIFHEFKCINEPFLHQIKRMYLNNFFSIYSWILDRQLFWRGQIGARFQFEFFIFRHNTKGILKILNLILPLYQFLLENQLIVLFFDLRSICILGSCLKQTCLILILVQQLLLLFLFLQFFTISELKIIIGSFCNQIFRRILQIHIIITVVVVIIVA